MTRNDFIRKKLQCNPKFIPFNEKYSSIELQNFIEKHKKKNGADIYGIGIALTTRWYNSCYDEMMSYIKKKIQIIGNDGWGIIQTIFAAANRDYYLLNKKVVFDKSVFSVNEISNLEVESPIEDYDSMNVIGAIEIQIDIANILINVLRYSIKEVKGHLILEEDKVVEIKRMYAAANVFHYIKDSYDTALWENGYIINKDNKYYVKYIDQEYPIARRIGDTRMQNNILGTFNVIEKLSKENKKFNGVLFMKKRKTQILKDACLDTNGYIQYSLKQGINSSESEVAYAMAVSEIDTYYPFITDKVFSSINDLCLNDLVIMFSKVATLIVKINERYKSESIVDTKLNNFLYKIKMRNLVQYLKDTTVFSKKQIGSFFKLIESRFENKERINLWSRPALRVEDTFYFLSTNIVAPNYAFLVDEWLESIGYELKERGTDFERYIKRELAQCLSKRNFFFKIPDINKFYINENDFEEIDLLINLKNIVIIGEVKCIKYPMNSRDSYNNLKRLRRAAKQVKRKAQYIYQNNNYFVNDIGNIENKKIIKVIISNYPIFAGTNVEGIPVIDYYLFDSYIRSGKLTRFVKIGLTDDSNKHDTSEEISYYSNEDEFCRNFEEFINKPLSISEIRENLSIKDRKLTLPDSDIHIYQEFVEGI